MRPVIAFGFAGFGGDFLSRADFFWAATGELVYLRSATRRGFLRLPSLIYLPARCLVYGCHTHFLNDVEDPDGLFGFKKRSIISQKYKTIKIYAYFTSFSENLSQ
jgi:hypothetical protein